MNFSYSNKTKRILSELRHKARTAEEIFEAIFPHDPSAHKVTAPLLGYMTPPKRPDFNALKRLEEKRFYTLLSKLRNEGIIKKQGTGAEALCRLTGDGLKKLLNYSDQTHPLNLPIKKYVSKKIDSRILVTFDIPENLKQYRNWIRYQLVSFGFTMLQKSVWTGTYQIPPDFLHDLRELNLMRYVHIFKVTDHGSID